MSDHTPEPLEVRYHGDAVWAQHWRAAMNRQQGKTFDRATLLASTDPHRVVASFNACAGIPTEALQPGSVGALIAEAQECEDYFDSRADADQPPGTSYPIGNEEMTRLTEIRAALAPFLKGETDDR